MAYAVKRGLGGSLNYMTSERAMLRFDRGEWSAADEDLQWVLGRPEEPGITHMPAMAVRARLAVRRGDPEARRAIDEAWALAAPTGELQRMAAVAAGKAELAWLHGDLQACRLAAQTAVGERRAGLLDVEIGRRRRPAGRAGQPIRSPDQRPVAGGCPSMGRHRLSVRAGHGALRRRRS